MFCRKCGKQIPDDSEFCYKCGGRVLIDIGTLDSADKPITLEKPSASESDTTTLVKPPPIIKDGKKICPKCGKKLSAPWCVYCGEEVQSHNVENLFQNNDEFKSRYKKALAALECSNDIDSLRRASDEFLALGAYLDSRKKSQDCKDKIYKIQNNVSTAIPRYDEQKAVKSSTSSASSTILENASLPNNNYSSSEEYASLKKGTLIALYVLMGIVVLFCMATGQLSFLGCPSLIEYEYEVSVSGMFTIFWWAIGLNIARAIFLGCCKAAHKNK